MAMFVRCEAGLYRCITCDWLQLFLYACLRISSDKNEILSVTVLPIASVILLLAFYWQALNLS